MLRDTIFSPAFGNRPSCLVGREGVLKGLCEGLQTAPGRKERSTVLLGQRGSGKTVLLWELAERASELGFVVATPTIVSEGMLARIVEKIQDAGSHFVVDVAPRISGGSFGAFGFEVGLEFSRDVQETKSEQFKLTQLARKLSGQGRGILILVDQLQANSVDVRELVSVYQELVGEGLDVALVMAGLPGAVSATLNDRVLTFLNRANKVTLGPLPSLDVEAFYSDAFERLGVGIAPEQISRATEATKRGLLTSCNSWDTALSYVPMRAGLFRTKHLTKPSGRRAGNLRTTSARRRLPRFPTWTSTSCARWSSMESKARLRAWPSAWA